MEELVEVGADMVGNNSPRNGWKFYTGASQHIGDAKGKDRTKIINGLRSAVLKARGIKAEHAVNFPANSTFIKRVGWAVKFAAVPATQRDQSLEVFDTANRVLKDPAKAIEAVIALRDELGHAVTINEARDAWPSSNGKGSRASGNDPMTIGEMIAYLVGQPNAVTEFARDAANVELVAELVGLLLAPTTNAINAENAA
jgi:hypothetical protein